MTQGQIRLARATPCHAISYRFRGLPFVIYCWGWRQDRVEFFILFLLGGTLGVYTCRGEHQGLQDVRQGHDAHDPGILIHHNQPVDLGTRGAGIL